MQRYNPSEIEPKWQKTWDERGSYHVTEDQTKPKLYVSGMFPYPSGSGLHSGHAFSYTIVDTIARFHRSHGKNVLNPMGWDTFGLPAENFAIKTGTAPAVVTKDNIANFKNQFKRLGISIDWDREINTSDPEYYRWTQWVFAEFFKRGLAYQKEAQQWWCPVDKTVLANEQVENGKCWRCGSEVEKKAMKQWFFKITDYADALLDEIPDLDWPEKIKTAQTNWIGRSEGMAIKFNLSGLGADNEHLEVFTTAHDTIYGVTFMVVAPEHPIVERYGQFADNESDIQLYVEKAARKSELDREIEKKKTGVQIEGLYAINPINGNKIPVWIADYVLLSYGTGAVMAVPGEDERDFEFAQKYNIPIIFTTEQQEFIGYGDIKAARKNYKLANSDMFDGMNFEVGRQKIMEKIKESGAGDVIVQYKMRDWLISRQRYWGAPIPIIHCEKDGAVAVPDDQLPVRLPEVKDYAPKGEGQSALAGVEEWVNTTCPTCGGPAKRETDTMDGYACSSWYLLRYADPHNDKQAWDPAKANYWSPVDYYVGGDHAVAHLLYVRFWAHVFNDMKLLSHKEPVKKLVYHGYINAEDGRKMSKSLGNVIDPLDIVDQGYGADTLRTYVLFMGPIELDSAWSSKGVGGVYRFLNRVWTLSQEFQSADKSESSKNDEALKRLTHKTIKKVTREYHELGFNTAIAAMMEFVNELYKLKVDGYSVTWSESLRVLAQLLSPVAPHMAAEIWQQLGEDGSLDTAGWPSWDEALVVEDTVTVVVQVNGKVRAKLTVAADSDEAAVTDLALSDINVQKFIENKKPAKVVYVPGRLVNIVVA